MKRRLLFLILPVCFLGNAQSGFGDANIIEILPYQISNVNATDIDGDGDNDVLFSDANANTIAWYENLDGLGTFGTINYISQTLDFTQSLAVSDLDSDGDMDVLASSVQDGTVVWYKNLDGQGFFGPAITIAGNLDEPRQTIAAEIDGLIGEDVIYAVTEEYRIGWHRNLNGQGIFIDPNDVGTTISGVSKIEATDIDGDGDLDIISNAPFLYSLFWFENNGQGIFITHLITADMQGGVVQVLSVDADNDNDSDIVTVEFGGDTISWFENLDGLGSFSEKKIIANIYRPSSIYLTDVDNDGDQDILATFVGDGKIAWFENLDGLGSFSERIEVDDYAATSIVGVDIDGDSYKDILTKKGNYQLVWYRNQTYLGIEENPLQTITLTPNPTSGIIAINNVDEPVKRITVFDMLGKPVLQQNGDNKTIDLSSLQQGLYLINIETAKVSTVKKVVKQ